jgi:type III pantothenate kinase
MNGVEKRDEGMRVLAIDAGNTRIKWGWFDGERWVKQSWVATAEASRLAAAFAGLPPPGQIVISNVAGDEVRGQIVRALGHLGGAPRWIRSAARQCGVTSSYSDPAQLGTDRWAALIGARQLFHGPCVVVNSGTTMTVDALSDEGVFLGGIIVPGAELMQRVLAQDTAQLERQEGRFTYFPDCTADAIASGVINALVGSIERMVQFMAQTGQIAPLIVLSGGAAQVLLSQLRARVEVVDNLVLEGLVRIALEPAAEC